MYIVLNEKDGANDMSEEKERILMLIAEDNHDNAQEEDAGVDYATEYRKQTGKDLTTGEYVSQ